MTEELVKLRFVAKDGSEFPDWESKKLGEVVHYQNKRTVELLSYITVENIGQDFTGLKNGIRKSDNSGIRVDSNSILIGNIRPYLKKMVFMDFAAKVNADVLALAVIDKNTLPRFIYSCISNDKFILYVMSNAQGTKMPRGNKSEIMKFPIPLPSLNEQSKIAGFLSAVDEKIEKQSELVELLELQKKGYAQKLFNGSLRFKKADGTDYDDWEERKLGEVLVESKIKGSNGLTAKKLIVRNKGKGVIAGTLERAGSSTTNYFKRSAGQLIYSKMAFSTGAFAIIPKELDGYESTIDAPSFDILTNIANPVYLITSILKEDWYTENAKKAIGTRIAKRVSQKIFLDSFVKLPSLPEQEKIAGFLSSLDERIANEREKLVQLKAEKTAYLQRVLV